MGAAHPDAIEAGQGHSRDDQGDPGRRAADRDWSGHSSCATRRTPAGSTRWWCSRARSTPERVNRIRVGERLEAARSIMADIFEGPPEFTDLIVVDEWTDATVRSLSLVRRSSVSVPVTPTSRPPPWARRSSTTRCRRSLPRTRRRDGGGDPGSEPDIAVRAAMGRGQGTPTTPRPSPSGCRPAAVTWAWAGCFGSAWPGCRSV